MRHTSLRRRNFQNTISCSGEELLDISLLHQIRLVALEQNINYSTNVAAWWTTVRVQPSNLFGDSQESSSPPAAWKESAALVSAVRSGTGCSLQSLLLQCSFHMLHAHDTGFYERYGWEFLCMVQGDGEPDMTRMYIHR